MLYTLKAPVFLDKHITWTEATYYENVQVVNGIARCERAITREELITKGYTPVERQPIEVIMK